LDALDAIAGALLVIVALPGWRSSGWLCLFGRRLAAELGLEFLNPLSGGV